MSDSTSTLPLPDFDRLWNFQKPDETEQAFRELLRQAEGTAERSWLVSLLSQIARSEGLQRKFDDAHRTLDRAAEILGAEVNSARVRLLLERGRVVNSSGKPEESIPFFLEAWDLARRVGEAGLAVDAAHMMGIVAPDDADKLAWNERAVEYAEESQDERALIWLGSLYNNIGWTLHEMGEYIRALDYFDRSAGWNEKMNRVRGVQIANWMIGRTFRSLRKFDDALEIQRALLKEIQAAGAGSDGYVVEEIGECLLAQDKGTEATPYFAQAWAVLSQDQWMVANEPARIERLKQLGRVESAA